MKSISRTAKVAMIFNIALGALCMLLLGQLVIAEIDQQKLRDYSASLVLRADGVAMQSARAIDEASRLAFDPCTDDDLFHLRFLVYKYRYLLDIGRLHDGKLICTAGRGILPSPLELPASDLVGKSGARLWRAIKGLIDPRMEMDAASQNDVVVFTSPDAFERFSLPIPGYSALITTADDGHIFQTFGAKETYSRQGSAWYQQYRLGYQCSQVYNICIYVRLNGSGIFSLPVYISMIVSLLGGLLSGALSLVAILLIERNKSFSKQLYRAVCDKQFHVRFQPIVCLRDNKMIGAEALIRWTNRQGEAIPPDVFIPVAEKMGIIGQITRQVTRMALMDLQDILTASKTFYISINLDISDVLDTDFQSYLDELTQLSGIARQQIMLEVTERSTANHTLMSKRLTELHDAGYRIALDDFGTGYSNLSYLAVMPFDVIKIDRIFTEAIGTDSVNAQMVEYLFNLMAMFDATVVVEGIETAEQAGYVGQHCPHAVGQGWYFGKPVSSADLKARYLSDAADKI
ncbi:MULTISPECIES: EAL domain-containing protein [unclassified Brenneria]|uniref:EAL domain-containing protein n=1 Tax=unclassified Brenneria TaxID=2634434 RepID=UPI00155525C8|nr:EAL domain-containing protein [Brenneria sp. hezel4-2-4]MEE3650351.1 EAL domain-containing protein [Brenneria sp. HEZEL_4_2_4]NPD00307.1 EAL domain-containing protein [Brenneria sp. hezel4-2-4]